MERSVADKMDRDQMNSDRPWKTDWWKGKAFLFFNDFFVN